jgi:hypothetical protein
VLLAGGAVDASQDFTSLHYRVTGTLVSTGRLKAEAFMGTEPAVMRMTMTADDYKGGSVRLKVPRRSTEPGPRSSACGPPISTRRPSPKPGPST